MFAGLWLPELTRQAGWEHDVVYAVVLALANGIPVPPHALM